jgi:hypothetical protein
MCNVIARKIYIYIVYSLAAIGFISILLILNFCLFGYKHKFAYEMLLAQKLKIDSYATLKNGYDKQYNTGKQFGEFCHNINGGQLADRKIQLTISKQKDEDQKIWGSVYANGNVYTGTIDPKTLDLKLDDSQWSWKWYNWLGIGVQF